MLVPPEFQPAGTLTLSDLIRFKYCHADRLTVFSVLLFLFACLGIIGVSLGPSGSFANPGVYFLMLLFSALFGLGSPYLAARKQYRSLPSLQAPMKFSFTNEGVRVEGPNFSGEIAWALVPRVQERKTAFLALVYQATQVAWILPKRFFRTRGACNGGRHS